MAVWGRRRRELEEMGSTSTMYLQGQSEGKINQNITNIRSISEFFFCFIQI